MNQPKACGRAIAAFPLPATPRKTRKLDRAVRRLPDLPPPPWRPHAAELPPPHWVAPVLYEGRLYRIPKGLTLRAGGDSVACDDCGAWNYVNAFIRHSKRCDTPSLNPSPVATPTAVAKRPKAPSAPVSAAPWSTSAPSASSSLLVLPDVPVGTEASTGEHSYRVASGHVVEALQGRVWAPLTPSLYTGRRNAKAGLCETCRGVVAANEGMLYREDTDDRPRWAVEHIDQRHCAETLLRARASNLETQAKRRSKGDAWRALTDRFYREGERPIGPWPHGERLTMPHPSTSSFVIEGPSSSARRIWWLQPADDGNIGRSMAGLALPWSPSLEAEVRAFF